MSFKEMSTGGMIGHIVAITALIVVGVLLCGWAASTVWEWFMVPKFGLPPLNIPEALAFGSIVGLFTMQNVKRPDSSSGDLTAAYVSLIGWLIIRPLLVVGFVALYLSFA